MRKVVCVTGVPPPPEAPAVPGLVRYAVCRPAADAPSEHPPGVAGIAMVWLDDGAALHPGEWLDGVQAAYLVDERVQWDYERTWPDGSPSPGVKRVSFVRRVPAITRAEFAAHWSDRHAPLARAHHPALWRYVQNVVVAPLTPGPPEVDGIAELHFRTLADLQDRFYDSEAGREAIAADVARFLARGAGWRMLAEETWGRVDGP